MKERERSNRDHNETFPSVGKVKTKTKNKKNRPFEYFKLYEKNDRRMGHNILYMWYTIYIELRIQKWQNHFGLEQMQVSDTDQRNYKTNQLK